ncbi:MAG TPA: nuclear transport factor 2 family protein [Xanthomonadaceae bacterium]|nr:nuclear transport factor 2 family protein [Xanthomonadaceae bacterium]
MRNFGLIVLLACAGWAASATASDTAEAELRTLLGAFLDGASQSDRAVHERFWADDLIYTSSAGRRFGKATILDGLPPEPAPGPARYLAEDVNVRIEGNMAVITFRLVSMGEDGTREIFLNSGVFRLRDGEWRAFTWQATRETVE